jgi:hypothetical protein
MPASSTVWHIKRISDERTSCHMSMPVTSQPRHIDEPMSVLEEVEPDV